MTNAPDIEIYVNNITTADAERWLSSLFDTIEPQPKKKGMPKNSFPYQVDWQSHQFQVIVFDNVERGFTSIWFNATQLPWVDDLACAQQAAPFFQRSVRVTAGGWNTHADPDAWIEINQAGEQTPIIWKTT
ncbi:MAG: hypothetical protein R3309_16125 [Reinekea sp.]|nr:hypothetical protein [Reinekea sp.]